MEAHLLSLNEFSRPKVVDGNNALYTNLIYLILLQPGKFQSHPSMGVGLRERYRHSNSEDLLVRLSNDIKDQCERFLPEALIVDVELTVKDTKLGIILSSQNGTYVMAYDSNTGNIEPGATYVLDNL